MAIVTKADLRILSAIEYDYLFVLTDSVTKVNGRMIISIENERLPLLKVIVTKAS